MEAQLKGLLKTDRRLYEALLSKIEEIVSSPDVGHYKNLKAPLQSFKRVHVMKSFVLIFSYDKTQDAIKFHKLGHHDKVYR